MTGVQTCALRSVGTGKSELVLGKGELGKSELGSELRKEGGMSEARGESRMGVMIGSIE